MNRYILSYKKLFIHTNLHIYNIYNIHMLHFSIQSKNMYSIIPYQRYLSERNHHYRRLELCNHKSSCGLVLPLWGAILNHPLQENTAYPILNHQLGMVYDWRHVNKSGWWYTYPSEKYDFVSWDYYSQYMEP